MTNSLRKAMIFRSRLKSNFSKKGSNEDWDNYKKQENFNVKFPCQTKEKYFSDDNVNSISDNKHFWKTIKLFFSIKGLSTNNIIIVENKKIFCDKEKLTSIRNDYFTNITIHLKFKPTKIGLKVNLKSIKNFFKIKKAWLFPSNFYYHYLVIKTQSSVEFQNLTIHPFHSNNSCFIAIVKVLFLIHYPLERHLEDGHIFSIFSVEVHFPAI